MTTSDFTIYIEPTKKEIIQRLFENCHITFNEMWTLLQDEPEVRYVPMPQQEPTQDSWKPFGPVYPYPWDQPMYYTNPVERTISEAVEEKNKHWE